MRKERKYREQRLLLGVKRDPAGIGDFMTEQLKWIL